MYQRISDVYYFKQYLNNSSLFITDAVQTANFFITISNPRYVDINEYEKRMFLNAQQSN